MKKSIIAIIFIAVFIVSCTPKEATEKQEVKVGAILPLGGVRAEVGSYHTNGIELALGEINSDPDRKYKIKISYEDSQYKTQNALSAFTKLTDIENIKHIIGMHSVSALAIAPLAQEKGILIISTGSQDDDLPKTGNYIFRTMTHTAQDSVIFAEVLAEKLKGETIHVLMIELKPMHDYLNGFTKIFEKSGSKIGLVEKYEKDASDFKTSLAKIKAEDGKHILLLSGPKHGALQLKQADELGLDASFYGISALENPVLFEVAGDLAGGLLILGAYDEESDDPAMQEFRKNFKEKYGKENEFYSAISYDSLHILADCFEEVGTEVDAVSDCILAVKDYHGASGVFDIDEHGNAMRKSFALKQVKDQKFVKVE